MTTLKICWRLRSQRPTELSLESRYDHHWSGLSQILLRSRTVTTTFNKWNLQSLDGHLTSLSDQSGHGHCHGHDGTVPYRNKFLINITEICGFRSLLYVTMGDRDRSWSRDHNCMLNLVIDLSIFLVTDLNVIGHSDQDNWSFKIINKIGEV